MQLWTTGRGRRGGFTLLELVAVLVIAGILVAVAVPRVGAVRREYAVRNARDGLVLFGALAQATALEMAETVCLEIEPDAGSVEMVVRETGEVIDNLMVGNNGSRADIETSSGDLAVCYTLRGFARPSLNTGNFPATVTFSIGNVEAQARVHALGEIEPL